MTPHDRGVWAVCLLVSSLTAMFIEFGLGSSAALLVSGAPRSSGRIVATALLLVTVIASCGVLAAVASMLVLGKQLFPGIPLAGILIGLTASLLVAVSSVARQLALGLGRLRIANRSVVLQSVLLTVLLAGGLTLFRLGPVKLVLVYVLALALTTVAVLLDLFRAGVGPLVWDRGIVMPMVTTGLKAHWAAVSLFVVYRVDVLLVNFYLGPAGAGVYSVALTLSEVLRGIPESAQTAVLSRLRLPDFGSTARSAARVAAAATLAAGTAMAAGGRWLVPSVFGEAYAEAAAAFVWLVPGIVALAASYALSPLLLRAGEAHVGGIGATVGAAVMVVIDIALVPRLGLEGAAIGSTAAYVTLTGVQLWRLRARGELRWADLLLRRSDVRSLLGWPSLERR
jgi:O-antigen/teichoic acid export membrane protein